MNPSSHLSFDYRVSSTASLHVYLSRDIAERMYAKIGEYLEKTDDDYPEPVKKYLM
ncbi:MAG: hypothetical protein PV362_08175 [Providencia heimbachae]|nr:hypothetical protein [Providencia heimbachae]